MNAQEEIIKYLKHCGIDFQYKEHPPAETLEQNEENVAGFGGQCVFCKNLLLTNKRKTALYLLLLPYEKRFQTAQASKAIGSSRLSLASDDELWENLRCVPGSASALGLIFDRERAVTLVADRSLLSASHICFHPNDNRATVCMPIEAFFNDFVKATDHSLLYVDLQDAELAVK